MDRGVFKAILLAMVLVGLAILTVAIYYPFLVALLWGAVLVTATYPIHRWLLARLRGNRTLTAAGMTLGVVICILLPFALIAPQFVTQARSFATDGVDEIRAVMEKKAAEEGSVLHRVKKRWVEAYDELDLGKLLAPTRTALTIARDTVEAVFSTLATILFLLIALFYFYRDGDDAVRLARELLPLKEEDRDLVMRDLRDAVNAAVRGGLLTALIQGALGGLIVAILGLPGSIFWATVIALASLIPLIGTALVWVPMATFLVWQGHPWKATILVAYGVVIIGSADNLLRPYLVGQHMKAHPMLLFFGIIGAIALFGLKGIVLGPVVVAGLTATTTLFRREFSKAA